MRHDECEEQEHDLQVDDPRVRAACQVEGERLDGRQSERILAVGGLVVRAERVRIERPEDEPAVPVDEPCLQRPVRVGVELDERLAGRVQHERRDEDAHDGAREQAAARSVDGRTTARASKRRSAHQRKHRECADDERRRRDPEVQERRQEHGGSRESGEQRRPDPRERCETVPGAGRHQRTRTEGGEHEVGSEEPGDGRHRSRTSQSVPNLQAPSGCAIPAAPGVVSRRSSHDAPVGAVSTRGARTYCVHDSPASQTNLVFGFGWAALPQRPPRTIENDALDGISASAARTSARSVPAVAAGPRANDAF